MEEDIPRRMSPSMRWFPPSTIANKQQVEPPHTWLLLADDEDTEEQKEKISTIDEALTLCHRDWDRLDPSF
jgi:hypothetical protein